MITPGGRTRVERHTPAGEASGPAQPLVSVRDLCVRLPIAGGESRILDHLDLTVDRGAASAIVGESGCGKSTLARMMIGLTPRRDAIVEGSILFDGQELIGLSESQYRRYRGRDIAMVFQDPARSFNPLMTVGEQIVEAIRLHNPVKRSAARKRAVDLLGLVRIPSPRDRFDSYPHQLSGGMRQRVMIAMALSCQPKLLVADEPTTALDVTTQAAIMDLLAELRREFGMALVLITHDLHLAARYSDVVSVMYAGHIVEALPASRIVQGGRVPYTVGLVGSIPDSADRPHSPLRAIRGYRPDPAALPSGCAFHPRCDYAEDDCKSDRPWLRHSGDEHWLACWHPLGSASSERGPRARASLEPEDA